MSFVVFSCACKSKSFTCTYRLFTYKLLLVVKLLLSCSCCSFMAFSTILLPSLVIDFPGIFIFGRFFKHSSALIRSTLEKWAIETAPIGLYGMRLFSSDLALGRFEFNGFFFVLIRRV